MAFENNSPFEDVVLAKTADSHGMVRNLAHHRGDDELVRVALGGVVAVRFCRSNWSRLFRNAFDDLGAVADFYRGDEQAEWGVDYNVMSTVETVSAGWGIVESLARQLLLRRRLTSDVAREIVAEARQLRRPPTRMTEIEWHPLITHIRWRIKYPRGLVDVFRELKASRST